MSADTTVGINTAEDDLKPASPQVRSAFGDLTSNPPQPDAIIALKTEFNADPNVDKVSFAIGVMVDERGEVFRPKSLLTAASQLEAEDLLINPDGYIVPFLPTEWNGDETFMYETAKLVFGPFANQLLAENRVAASAGVGGTQPAAILAKAFRKRADQGEITLPQVVIGQPGYPNHAYLFRENGFGNPARYNHLKADGTFDLENTLQAIEHLDRPTLLVLQGNAHNPTGLGPRTAEEWQMIVDATSRNPHVSVFIDFAYAGLDDRSDIEADFEPARLFALSNTPTFIGVSFSKNAGMYDGRVGVVYTVCNDTQQALGVTRLFNGVIRAENSSPPGFGERVVARALTNQGLRRRWHQEELPEIAEDTTERRNILADALPDDIAEIVRNGIGPYTTLPITRAGAEFLKIERHVYVVPIDDNTIRICFGAATKEQTYRAAPAIREALEKYHS